jgi:hypothetical protein
MEVDVVFSTIQHYMHLYTETVIEPLKSEHT